ncbi:MAG: triple tyrosine motif-containing protein [Reichenbachiella sp.]|uniref:sensor histidine kinase n=1 Tax=Reichenbachiella sp. TaxID=2184521 RepID=UPI002965EB90|nr:triple tyrosine motif-containing protein [Reichenbachiella sp.]MDW3210644.1 triple tyrosine motif-containing protein [Reichenbachiella sp.]
MKFVKLNEFNLNHGLASNHITKIVTDRYDHIWVGTQEGLNLFDGKEFRTFSNQSQSKHNIQGSLVQDLVMDTVRSLIWVQTAYASISAIDITSRTISKSIILDHKQKSFAEQWVRCIDVQGDVLWIGGLDALSAYHIPTDSFLRIEKIEKQLETTKYNISKILHDDYNRVWLFNEGNGIQLINDSRETIIPINIQKLKEKQNVLFRDAIIVKNNIFVASTIGLIHLNIGESSSSTIKIIDSPDVLSDIEVRAIEPISNNQLLISTSQAIFIYHLITKKVTQLIDEKVKGNSISGIFEISSNPLDNLIWVGTQSGLSSFALTDKTFSPYPLLYIKNLKLSTLYSLLPTSKREVLVGSNNSLFSVDLITQNIDVLDTTNTNLLLFRDNSEDIVISNSNQISRLKRANATPNKYLIEEHPYNHGLKDDFFNSAINYNDSILILSSVLQKGLTVWNTRCNSFTTYHQDSIGSEVNGLRKINNLFKNRDKNVLILTDNSIVQFNPLNQTNRTYVIHNSKNNETLTNFMDITEVGSSYFIGSYGDGLIETDREFNIKRIHTTKDGLSNNCVYRIFNIENKKLLMTTNNGLSILDLKSKKIKTYYEGDGLHGNGFEQLCGYQKDNKIYVGGPGGFTIVNTDLLPDSSVAPILYPTGITINTPDGKIDSTHLEMSSFTIPNDAFKTTLKFVSPDYKNPDRMKYRYKIDELSEEWVELGNQNFVDLIGVNPGKYHFEVIATNSEGTDSEPLKMTLDFLPKWYQTTWFKVLLLLLVAGLVYWVQRYRMVQIKKQQTIRKEIANDLHDDIGSTLNSLKIFAHLAQSDKNNKSHIEQIEESISEATVGLRDMIWVLEDEQDSVYEIMERIKKFASPICMAHDIEFVGTVNATSEKPIPKKIKRNIFLVAKECINNSVKYAECSRIEVVLAYSKSKLQLTIEDNGKGFDCDEITKGKGLDSMEYRANQVEFNCDIQSRIGSGTITTMQGTIG